MALLILGLAAAAVAAAGTTTLLRVRRGCRAGSSVAADAIVVFGAAVGPRGPSPELQARVDHAAKLYREGRARIILCSGGFTGNFSEAGAMRAALVRKGVPPAAVLVDESGTSTRRTGAATLRHGRSWRSVLAVSSPYHMHRISAESRRQGLCVIPSPAPTTPVMGAFAFRTGHELREVAAVWWYALLGSLPWSRLSAEP